ncbi:hypothetical protein IZ6_01700 [Terrihabitans soli]|uniref:Uncharacterized protein n=1 Tax=Terrihabitans soli TaxID=708113 RepID=A0A6S6QNQ3_9HYPH|nr:hypothetical protein [Terrihabitans soli]BCJ89435.1 hypothetical protein IZ6_01700 [Terrihabitans soli]
MSLKRTLLMVAAYFMALSFMALPFMLIEADAQIAPAAVIEQLQQQ